ncbi:A/G-specific adenine glycosylase [Aquibacillus koreensis]|uniref:Adenine DNA glycosylase n=1 Tax=Aquibacillus koreensis TaxID=279446 RepID=A0A9X3WL32_9BACI|nr:A/G-specific adenine glycosylase [Aquibacillus koreensis]MCT2534378.1 A/G-specific adenine glycosylase [Aquibacillus koreensis]MDC3421685.1 A/G-specific adenine glycosylase [Aquibacillus koreensis]
MKQNEIKSLLNNFNIDAFQQDLIDWFESGQRDLPWRLDQDPYKVWVSEIMLQQTKVDTVIPYFNNFLEKFPTLQDLADAPEQEVLKAWEGLGYYSRARNLQNAVQEVVASYGGEVPDNPKDLGDLKGVGPYTKGAILSIAFGQPEPAVDGNVMRVLSRVLLVDQDIAKQSTRKLFEACIYDMIAKQNPSAFNQGLMELGALICTPKSPSCLLCPVQKTCRAFHEGVQDELPIKGKAKKQKTIQYATLVIENEQGEILIEQRPSKGLLANMWQFPMIPLASVDLEHAAAYIEQLFGIEIELREELLQVKHVFSHIIWEMKVFKAKAVSATTQAHERSEFVSVKQLTDYPFPVPHQKIRNTL